MNLKPAFLALALISISTICIAQFNQSVHFSSSATGYIMDFGDVDGDGIPDMVGRTVPGDYGRLAWSKGNGDGTYTGQGEIVDIINVWDDPTINNLVAFAVADLDNDGDDDIVAIQDEGSPPPNSIYIVESNGDGTFADPVLLSNQSSAAQVKCADLDGNGLIDIVIGSGFGNQLILHMQEPLGSYSEIVLSDNPDYDFDGAHYLELADANGDGFIDIKSCRQFANIAYNDGNGNFEVFDEFPFVSQSNDDVVMEDFDGDGDVDMVVERNEWIGNSNINIVMFLENIDGEMVEKPDAISNLLSNSEYSVRDLVAGDFNMDGMIDFAVGKSGWSKAEIHLNLGNNQFEPIILCTLNAVDPNSLFVADFNLDGAPDLAYTRNTPYRYLINDFQFCNDLAACNYNPEWDGENLNCCYSSCGCTDDDATNYDSEAICDDGSCLYSMKIRLFDDLNADGIMDSGEPSIENVGVQLNPGGYVSVSTMDGTQSYATFTVPRGQYTTSVFLPDNYSSISTGTPVIEANCVGSGPHNIGLVSSGVIEPSGALTFFPASNAGLCNQIATGNACFTNMGTTADEFVINVQPGDLVESILSVSPSWDATADGDGYSVSLNNVLPGQTKCIGVQWYNPGVDELGEQLGINASLFLADDSENALDSLEFLTELLCAYDPNDKLVSPEGILEGNFVPLGSDLRYTIRFQNTGTAPAQTVLLRDTLPEELDITSISMIGHSHEFYFNYDPESREMVFAFPEIELPAVDVDEPGSHGFVAFRIEHNEDLVVTTEVNNTAYIYFDANPPIITNTTLTTLYECNDFFAAFSEEQLPTCINESSTVFANVGSAGGYEWVLDGSVVSIDSYCTLSNLPAGLHTLSLSIESPICDAGYEMEFSVVDCTVGVVEVVERHFNIFPNPTNESIHIVSTLGDNGLIDAKIFSTSGQLLVNKEGIQVSGNAFAINLKELASGVYVIQIIDSNGSVLQRDLFVKQ